MFDYLLLIVDYDHVSATLFRFHFSVLDAKREVLEYSIWFKKANYEIIATAAKGVT